MSDPLEVQPCFVVRGGQPLRGELRINGAKNSALKLMSAALMAEGTTVLTNVPRIADVPVMGEVLVGLGAKVDVDGDRVEVTVGEPTWWAPREHVVRIRASISVLGPLVGRLGRARVAWPGGDRIGERSIDMHLRGLIDMGARVQEHGEEIEVIAPRLYGTDITLDFPSVGATENLVMAAALADGRTVLDNAAREPEVQDLCSLLAEMGAVIDGIGTQTLTIDGVDQLHAVEHATVPDRIEAGTLAFAAAATNGDITLTGLRTEHLRLPLMKLVAAGAVIEDGGDWLRVKGDGLQPVDAVTLPYPGFPTDLQPQLMVLLSQAHGTSIVTENVFESRFAFVDELSRLGADITIDGHHAVIRGRRRLHGATVRALDVRAGAACLIAGLLADGETRIVDIQHVDRGYADIVGRLRQLGADIERREGA